MSHINLDCRLPHDKLIQFSDDHRLNEHILLYEMKQIYENSINVINSLIENRDSIELVKVDDYNVQVDVRSPLKKIQFDREDMFKTYCSQYDNSYDNLKKKMKAMTMKCTVPRTINTFIVDRPGNARSDDDSDCSDCETDAFDSDSDY